MSSILFLELQDNILEKVAKTFDKTEDTLNEEVREIRKWLETQHHLPELMNEKLVKNFYLLNKCRMEKTKEKIDNYYTVRCQSKDMFATINPKLPNMKFFMEAVYYFPLPKLTEDMYRVLVCKIRDPSIINDVDPYDLLRHFVNIMEIKLHEDVCYGDVCIFDATGVTTRYLLKLTPLYLYKILIIIYDRIYSSRLKVAYMINCPTLVEKIMELMKKVLKPKLFNRFHLKKDPSIIREAFSEDILPKDYGGSERSLEELQAMLANKFEEYQDRFDQLDQLRVDEKLRPEKEKSSKRFGLW